MSYNEALADAVREIKEDNRVCVTLGGDHSISIGSLAGHNMGVPDKQVI